MIIIIIIYRLILAQSGTSVNRFFISRCADMPYFPTAQPPAVPDAVFIISQSNFTSKFFQKFFHFGFFINLLLPHCGRHKESPPALPHSQSAGAADPIRRPFPPLALRAVSCYNRHEKQKCGSLRVGQHPQACAGVEPTYTTAERPHRMEYDTTVRPFCKGRLFSLSIHACVAQEVSSYAV